MIAYRELHLVTRGGGDLDVDRSVVRAELDCVVDQVHQHLPKPQTVNQHHRWARRVNDQRSVGCIHLSDLHDFARKRGQIGGRRLELHLAGIHPRRIQQSSDQGLQPRGVLLYVGESSLRVDRLPTPDACQPQLARHGQRRHGRAQLV